MRLAMYEHQGHAGIAASDGGGFHGLAADHPDYPGDLDNLLSVGAELSAVGKRLLAAPRVALDDITLLPPLRHPNKIICMGLNYRDHSAETGYAVPDYPTIFTRFTSTLIGHNAGIVKPPFSDQLDYEGEMVAVIGRGGRNIPHEQALSHVAGYSIFNDASVRDYQFRTPQWTMGKNFDATGAFGPWLVTADELPPGGRGLRLQTRLNGEVVQDANTADMVFDVATQIALLSEVMTLVPGDVLVTGTPAGIGYSRTPQLFMKAGDVCEVEIERIGVLRNVVTEGLMS